MFLFMRRADQSAEIDNFLLAHMRENIGGFKMNKFLQVTYAVSVALSQALVSYGQIRADQKAVENMTDKQIKQLMEGPSKAPIGFGS